MQNAGRHAAISSRGIRTGAVPQDGDVKTIRLAEQKSWNSFITDGQPKAGVCRSHQCSDTKQRLNCPGTKREEKLSPQYRVLERNWQHMKEEEH